MRKTIRARICEAENSVSCQARGDERKKPDGRHLDKLLKPFTLTKENSPTDLCLWKSHFQNYLASSGIQKLEINDADTLAQQRAHLLWCINVDLMKMVQQKSNLDTPTYGEKGYMQAIDKIFVKIYPIF